MKRVHIGVALVVFLLFDVTVGVYWWYYGREHSQDRVIMAAAQKYGVEPALIKAVVWRESWFNPRAQGTKGEVGLMQIRLPVGREWAQAEGNRSFEPNDLYDPGINTMVGAWYLRRLVNRYRQTDNPLAFALSDYNAGRTHTLEWNYGSGQTNSTTFVSQVRFPTTRQYIETVQKRYQRYQTSF